jgi:hypothetical protein
MKEGRKGRNKGRNKRRKEGRKEGLKGRNKGREEGKEQRKEGRKEGRKDGRKDGKKEWREGTKEGRKGRNKGRKEIVEINNVVAGRQYEVGAIRKEPVVVESLSLTVTTLPVCAINNFIFEYRNQVTVNMTVFDGGPSLSY